MTVEMVRRIRCCAYQMTLAVVDYGTQTRSNPAACPALEVVHRNVNHTSITPEGELDLPLIRPLARLGCADHTAMTDVFNPRIPGATDDITDGLTEKS